MTCDGCAAVNSRARCRVLFTTPVRLRSKSRPSKPRRSIATHFVEDTRQVTRQQTPIEAHHLLRIRRRDSAGLVRAEGTLQNARNRRRIVRGGKPATANLIEDVGSRGFWWSDAQYGSTGGQVFEQFAWHRRLRTRGGVGNQQQHVGGAHSRHSARVIHLPANLDSIA